ncbi:MAG: bifunctional oligoribonuclease/PAP phosphatase NrnA [Bacteroidaceae bacterium]|jgi:phosphoesterase RecJ-like protein|nr:bifunctional oligoribonuclease/PAP phosphatase NrnA [Bacteroidaceae bacterium]MBQ8008665.1 bifunctional oligoribonuclease/PAP phosphatase NrnA [Bacteroidaceae bacterium]
MLTKVIAQEHVAAFSEWLEKYKKFVIVAHTNPDGDAVGSSLALYHYLRYMRKKVCVILPNQFPDFFKWMPGAEYIMPYNRYLEVADRIIAEADVICCLDFNQLNRIDAMEEKVRQSEAKKILIDHHIGPEEFADICISHPEQSSTCELLYRFLCDLGYYYRMSNQVATCIYTGMMTDTGGFTFNSNNPEIFFIVSMLLRKQVDKDLVYRKVNYNFSASRLLLQGEVLSGMELLPEYHTAILTLTKEQQKEFKYSKGDSEGFVNMPLQIKDVIFTCFLREDTEKDMVKVSLRSIGEFPCNVMALEFNGGGHKNASGGELPGMNAAEATEHFKKVLEKYKGQLEECFNQHPK